VPETRQPFRLPVFAKPLKISAGHFGDEHAFPDAERPCEMFRACYSHTADALRWNLHGRLAGPWVDVMRLCWKEARERTPIVRAIVDLEEITFIDQAGERLLAEMRAAGVELIATGVEHQHLLAMLDNHLTEGRDK